MNESNRILQASMSGFVPASSVVPGAPAGPTLRQFMEHFFRGKGLAFFSDLKNMTDEVVVAAAGPFQQYVAGLKKKEMLGKVNGDANVYAQHNGDERVKQYVTQLFGTLGQTPAQQKAAFMNLTASVMSMAVKWKHEGNPPKRRTRMACADRVVTQGDFVQLMRTSTAFRIAFSKMLLSNVKGAFLLDISITNAQETLVVEQTLANRLSFKVFGPNIPGPLRKPGPGWCKTMKDRHAKNQHLMVTPTLVNKDADTQAYLNLYTFLTKAPPAQAIAYWGGLGSAAFDLLKESGGPPLYIRSDNRFQWCHCRLTKVSEDGQVFLPQGGGGGGNRNSGRGSSRGNNNNNRGGQSHRLDPFGADPFGGGGGGGGGNNGGNNGRGIQCHNCKGYGHKQANCPQKGGNRGGNRNNNRGGRGRGRGNNRRGNNRGGGNRGGNGGGGGGGGFGADPFGGGGGGFGF
eukprot:INCI7643.1.p1 GENE.INCI7643.1~~INCI7643.1.p1  ORF type:complete len:458 (-),score=80.80 INCI7643.1:2543-3916(-)